MAIMETLLWPESPSWALLATVSLSSLAMGAALQSYSCYKTQLLKKTLPSPRTTLLPKLSPKQVAELPYPPDVLPGGREVESQYGTFRVNEWGPEKGRKVLLIHGISRPSIALADVAHDLVRNGCRVMLLDIWGRGWSDSPIDVPHDSRIYITQILVALASSKLPWTGEVSGGFSLVGYSMGGAIAISFFTYFPRLVSSLILFGPAGIIREDRLRAQNRLASISPLIPQWLIEWAVKRRLIKAQHARQQDIGASEKTGVEEVSEQRPSPQEAVAQKAHPSLEAAHWQINSHEAYVPSMVSTIIHFSLTSRHAEWRKAGTIISAQNSKASTSAPRQGLEHGKVLIIAGSKDVIIVEKELIEDATETLGGNRNVDFRIVKGAGHDFPVVRSSETVDFMFDFWKMKRLA
ncbi:MAG: hypothetical protein M1829_003622 [Trizodia sp. TS-e1964]|nr:MAG: hypothetical protein M1829_003622 [Trizodia sp. TS-e1964]